MEVALGCRIHVIIRYAPLHSTEGWGVSTCQREILCYCNITLQDRGLIQGLPRTEVLTAQHISLAIIICHMWIPPGVLPWICFLYYRPGNITTFITKSKREQRWIVSLNVFIFLLLGNILALAAKHLSWRKRKKRKLAFLGNHRLGCLGWKSLKGPSNILIASF